MRSPRLDLRNMLFGFLAMLLAAAWAPAPRAADDALYQALGAQGGITVLVDEYLEVVADDSRIAPTFMHSDIPHLREKLIEYICMLSGGPCKYTGDPMEVVHGGLNITEAQFNAMVEDLQETMTRMHLPESTQNRLLARLAPLRAKIIYR